MIVARRLLAVLLLCGAMPAFAQDPYSAARGEMVKNQIAKRGVNDTKVLDAMRVVPRHLFVPSSAQAEAYDDRPLAIGEGQTISQPYIVALMTETLNLTSKDKVLEIGTGSGYQAAVLSKLVSEVYTIEILKPLGEQAQRTLSELGYSNVHVRIGDGYQGWPEAAPFDAIIVTAAPEHIPEPLKQQLKIGGRMIIPVGNFVQDLVLLTKTQDGFTRKNVAPVRFVPMTGEVQNGQKPPPPQPNEPLPN
jgi:protein-L-isoaspartate(D-aspartate) O-methyltransferase